MIRAVFRNGVSWSFDVVIIVTTRLAMRKDCTTNSPRMISAPYSYISLIFSQRDG